jgi:GntR family transcriptional regulator
MSDAETRAIDRATPIPFYYQLQEILKEEIERGTWRSGDLLPSEAQLERRFGVSRTVVRQALDVLQADGQISRVKGKRSMVTEPKFRWEATIGARHWNQRSSPNKVTIGRLVDARRVHTGGHVARVLCIEDDQAAFELTFTQEVGGKPVALSQTYLNPRASTKLEEACLAGGQVPVIDEQGPDLLDQLASRYGIEVALSQVTVELTQVNEFEAALLDVSLASPAFLLTAVDLDADNKPITFTRMVIRGDRFRFSLAINHQEAEANESAGLIAHMTEKGSP